MKNSSINSSHGRKHSPVVEKREKYKIFNIML